MRTDRAEHVHASTLRSETHYSAGRVRGSLPLITSSPVTQNDGHQSAPREASREEPAGVGNLDQGPDHDHRTPKQAQPTFHGNSVNSDARMYSHRQFLQSGLRSTGQSTPWPA